MEEKVDLGALLLRLSELEIKVEKLQKDREFGGVEISGAPEYVKAYVKEQNKEVSE